MTFPRAERRAREPELGSKVSLRNSLPWATAAHGGRAQMAHVATSPRIFVGYLLSLPPFVSCRGCGSEGHVGRAAVEQHAETMNEGGTREVPASKKRMILVVYLDLVLFSAAWGLGVHFLAPGRQLTAIQYLTFVLF